jgi:GMP synthase (glutamine-hydrolysing)
MPHQKILILDFGSQVTQLIARRVREAHVFCEVVPCDVSSDWVQPLRSDGLLKGIILSGSHASTYEAHDLRAPQAVYELGVPVLGICYGMFTMAVQLGGRWRPAPSASSAMPTCAPAATRAAERHPGLRHVRWATAC